MSTNQPDDEALESFADAFKELMELQAQIDESARSIVESVRTTVDHRAEYLAVRAADYPGHDAGYYDGTGKELAAEGIGTLGDFEDATFSRRNPDKQVFVRLGLANDGTIGAMWFRLGTASSVSVSSWLEDGRTITTFRAATESSLPVPATSVSERLPLETSVRDLVRRHRSRVRATGSLPRQLGGIDDLLAAFAADELAVATFREGEGVALFEPMLRAKLGDRYEDEGEPLVESIRAHPEWWTGEDQKAEHEGDGGFHLMFLRSAETSGRWHFTTAGLAMFGLPELQMKEVAGNHCRAARFLMAVVARKLRDGATGPELALGLADVPHPNVFLTRPDEVAVDGEARVLLVPEGFGDEAPDVAGLIHLVPPKGYRGDKDQWLRESCRCLGQDAPKALGADQFEIEMAAASKKAKGTLAALRSRFRAGLEGDEQLLIKVGLTVPTGGGGREFVWVSVREWNGDVLVGTLETEPHNVPGIKQGQEMRVAERDVFDRTIYSRERGVVEVAMTDIVAQEFGVDV